MPLVGQPDTDEVKKSALVELRDSVFNILMLPVKASPTEPLTPTWLSAPRVVKFRDSGHHAVWSPVDAMASATRDPLRF